MATLRLTTAWTALLIFAGLTPSQEPGRLPRSLTESTEPERAEGFDPAVQPAAARQGPANPVPPIQIPATSGPSTRPLEQLPTPAISLSVRGPADAHRTKGIHYLVTLTNNSPADAYDVNLIVPLPKVGAASGTFERLNLEDAKPEPLPPEGRIKIGNMPVGTRHQVEIVVTPNKEADRITLVAKVSFEHGVIVRTKLADPQNGLKVTHKVLVDKVVRGVPFACRMEVQNTGKATYTDLEISETLRGSLEADPTLEPVPKPDVKQEPKVLSWKIPALRSGETRTFEYRLIDSSAENTALGEYTVSAHGATKQDKWEMPIAEAKMEVDITGPADRRAMIQAPALYQINVHNSGSADLNNVLIDCKLPHDVQATRTSAGSQQFPDDVQWIIPRLKPNEDRTVKLYVSSAREGPHELNFTVRAKPVKDFQKAVDTEFYGSPTINWKSTGDGHVVVGGDINYAIVVQNGGNGPAKKVILKVELPPEVAFPTQTMPIKIAKTERGFDFDPVEIPANGEVKFTLRTKAKASGEAGFKFLLKAEHFGDQEPLQQEKTTIITAK